MNKKAIFLPPLFGSFVALLFVVVHLFLTNISMLKTSSMWISFLFSLVKILPITFLLLSIIAYFFYFTLGYILLKIKNKYYYSAKFFWFMSLLTGFLTGLILVFSTNYIEYGFAKSALIITSFSLGSLFTASLFSVLNDDIK